MTKTPIFITKPADFEELNPDTVGGAFFSKRTTPLLVNHANKFLYDLCYHYSNSKFRDLLTIFKKADSLARYVSFRYFLFYGDTAADRKFATSLKLAGYYKIDTKGFISNFRLFIFKPL